MKRAPGYDPIITNAHVNRNHAAELYQAGFSVRGIAAEFPRVFKASLEDGQYRLGQHYSVELDDGRLETDITVTAEAVAEAIARGPQKAEHRREVKK